MLEGFSKDDYVGEISNRGDLNCQGAGEAAKYGIFFDDRDYDYTQHLRPIGHEGGVYIEAGETGRDESSGLWNKTMEYVKEAVLTVDASSKNELDDPEVKHIIKVLQEDMESPSDTYSLPDNLVELLNDQQPNISEDYEE